MTKSPSFLTLENFRLECGAVLEEARLVYQTYGELASDVTDKPLCVYAVMLFSTLLLTERNILIFIG